MFKKFYKTLLCACVTGAVIMQCGCASLSFRQEYDKGINAYNKKNYPEAIIYFNNALNHKPDSYSALCLLGTSYAYNKELKLAEKTFQDAVRLFPNEWNAYVFLAEIKTKMRDYDVAIDLYETAVTLESMGGKEKIYYKNLLKELKEERAAYALKDPFAEQQRKENFKTEIINSYTGEKSKNTEIENPTGEVILTLDAKKWEKAFEHKDEKSKIIEYGIKGEDVKNFKWTQLVTVQYFILSENFKTSLDEYYKTHIGAIEAIAKNSGKTFEKRIISQNKNEILYEWKFDNAQECEIARVVHTPKLIYHLHFAKKGAFTNDEKSQYIEILKTAILR